jgi:hypothetical protein
MDADRERIEKDATERARKLAAEINEKAAAKGYKVSKVAGGAHYTKGFYHRPTGHVEIAFEALAGGAPRRRAVNDCKKPIDVDKIIALLVECQAFRDRQAEAWRREGAAREAASAVATELKAIAPEWLHISGSSSGVIIEARYLTAERARAIVEALKGVL